jgi:hypothetical protein
MTIPATLERVKVLSRFEVNTRDHKVKFDPAFILVPHPINIPSRCIFPGERELFKLIHDLVLNYVIGMVFIGEGKNARSVPPFAMTLID